MAAAGCYHEVVKVIYGGYLLKVELLHLTKKYFTI